MQSKNDFDLDITNYTKKDMFAFFKLPDNFTEDQLNQREKEMSLAILNAKDEKYTNEYKFRVLNFVKTVKDVLKGNATMVDKELSSPIIEQELDGLSNLPKPLNNVGRIINPLSNHPSLQTTSIPSNTFNGYNVSTTITNYVFNSKFRDEYFTTISSNSTYSFPVIKNVVSVALSGLQFPNVIYTFADDKKTTQIYIKDDTTGKEAVVIIPQGNYEWYEFGSVLEKAINEQVLGVYNPDGPNIFKVEVEYNTHHTSISNSSGTFVIRTITQYPNTIGVDCQDKLHSNYKYDDTYKKEGISPSLINNTLGYQIGYRSVLYSGANKYRSEACYNGVGIDYIYFSMNEFSNANYVKNTLGVLPSSFLENNILGVIPIRSAKFTFSFDNGADFIFKTRNYTSPIDISRINIKLLDPIGRVLDIHFSDISFILQFTTIFDNTIQYSYNAVSII